MDIYRHKTQLEKIDIFLEKSNITERNKEIIKEFKTYSLVNGLSKSRVLKYMSNLKKMAEWFDMDFDKAKKKDVERVVGMIRSKEYSEWTKRTYCIIIKRFYKWLYGNDEEYPKEVSWIKNKLNRSKIKLPGEGDLITEDEIKLVLEKTAHPRNKALISVLFESGCRIGELASLRLKHVVVDKNGVLLTVLGKTGSRKIRIIGSTACLMNWLSVHPLKDDKDAPLWVSISMRKPRELCHQALSKMIKKSFAKAGLKKRVYAHLFRHSRATLLANHLTEFQMNQYFGWIQGSGMPSTYVHLSGRDMDNALLKFNGIEVEATEMENKLKPRICPRCEAINDYDSSYCKKCTAILDEKLRVEVDEKDKLRKNMDQVMNMLLGNEEFKKMVVERLK